MILLAFLLAIFHADAWSHETVKVVSGLLGDPRPMQGSGLYFTRKVGGTLRAFVVTSDHVEYHGNEGVGGTPGYYHSIWTERTGKWHERRARYLGSEAGYGLALLEVLGPVEKTAPFPPLSEVRVGLEVYPDGYPYGSRSGFASLRGRVAAVRSAHSFFPLEPPMIEIVDARGEFGMSGGPVSERFGDGFVGILSHREVRIDRSNRPSSEWRNGQPIEIRLFAIPGQVVLEWLEDYFRDPEGYAPYYWTSPANQVDGDFMRTAGLWLWNVCKYAQQGETFDKCQVGLQLASKVKDPHERSRFLALSVIADRLRTQPGLESATIMAFRPSGRPTRRGLIRHESFLEFYRLMARVESGELEPIGPTRTKAVTEYHFRDGRQPGLQAAVKTLREARPPTTGRIGAILELLSLDRRYEFPDDYWIVKPSDLDLAIAEAGTDERLRAALVEFRAALARVSL